MTTKSKVLRVLIDSVVSWVVLIAFVSLWISFTQWELFNPIESILSIPSWSVDDRGAASVWFIVIEAIVIVCSWHRKHPKKEVKTDDFASRLCDVRVRRRDNSFKSDCDASSEVAAGIITGIAISSFSSNDSGD